MSLLLRRDKPDSQLGSFVHLLWSGSTFDDEHTTFMMVRSRRVICVSEALADEPYRIGIERPMFNSLKSRIY